MTVSTAQQPAGDSLRSDVAAANPLLLGEDVYRHSLACEANEVIAANRANIPRGVEADVTRQGVVPGVPAPEYAASQVRLKHTSRAVGLFVADLGGSHDRRCGKGARDR